MGRDESMSSNNCSNEQILNEVLEIKKLLVQVLQYRQTDEKPNRKYKNSDAEKEKALQIGRRMLIMSAGVEGIPSVRELADAMGVSTASLYKKETKKGKNPYHSIIVHRNMLIHAHSYSQSSSLDAPEGYSDIGETSSGDKHRNVDGVHYDPEIDDF